MPRERTQLNINIDPSLLVRLKSEAIKQGKTLTDFVVDILQGSDSLKSSSNLEERLLKIESFLKLDENVPNKTQSIGTLFTDEGAKGYGKVAKKEFEEFAKKKGITLEVALEELATVLKKYPYSNPELVFQILIGNHDLTGLEMTLAYRRGSCAMRSALNEWTNDSLEALNEAFLKAVKTKNLVGLDEN